LPTKGCPSCGGKVSEIARACVHCGHPLTQGSAGLDNLKDTIGGIWGCAVMLAGLLIMIGILGGIIKAIFG
jgi:hypothetical protein